MFDNVSNVKLQIENIVFIPRTFVYEFKYDHMLLTVLRIDNLTII